MSLMNYTYVPEGEGLPHIKEACVVLTSSKETQKVKNICQNPNVSLLVHDWTTSKTLEVSEGSTLSRMLKEMNQTELSSKSITLDGCAKIVEGDVAEFFRKKLQQCTPENEHKFIDDTTAVILVTIQSATVADSENRVQVYDDFSS